MLGTRAAAIALLLASAVSCSGQDDGNDTAADSTTTTSAQPGPDQVTGPGFYDVPAPLPIGEPGTLLRYEPLEEPLTGIPDATAYRLMYLSESTQGDAIAVTGLAVVPAQDAPADGRRLLGMGHATTGVADDCAPSRTAETSDLRLAAAFVDAGYLVAMSDYEGMGTPGRHPYLVGESAGRSVLDAVRAARQLPGAAAGERLALAGYQQGGHAALWAAELAEDWAPDLDLVATFAGAPLSEMDFEWNVASSLDYLAWFFALIAAGFHAGYPETDLGSLLTEEGTTLVDRVDTTCVADLVGATAGTRLDGIVRPGAAGQAPWVTIAADSVAGTTAVDAPLLIVHSEADDGVPVFLSATLADRLCAAGQQLERVVLPDGDGHLAAAQPAYDLAFDWTQARFAGDQPATTCPG